MHKQAVKKVFGVNDAVTQRSFLPQIVMFLVRLTWPINSRFYELFSIATIALMSSFGPVVANLVHPDQCLLQPCFDTFGRTAPLLKIVAHL